MKSRAAGQNRALRLADALERCCPWFLGERQTQNTALCPFAYIPAIMLINNYH